ncbi:MAG: formate dehydrogenase accessory sulfurtransferase FdhD [Candidatus Hydrogenedentes bacterium]|nr:formate dehydrogenase accessory sulfurtransferase FdhD [Candidatus Hydrogenedentota bacterium]
MIANSVETGLIEKFDATKIDKNGRRTIKDSVAKTSILTIYVNGSEIVSLVCSPTCLDALAVGFLVSEGFLTSRDELGSVTIVEGRTYVADVSMSVPHRVQSASGRMLVTPGCGGGATFANRLEDIGEFVPLPDAAFRRGAILKCMRELGRKALLFRETGGVHTAALFSGNELTRMAEDVGRHNALDKILGTAFLEGIEVAGSGVLTSGRLSVDAVMKALVRRIPLLVSRTAPTSMAVQLARRARLTLVGFARGDRMNVYSAEERIVAG